MPTSSLNNNQPSKLNNITCIYCGKDLKNLIPKEDYDEEHVIGRGFVPKGTLDKQWNLIAYACKKCNGDKGDLEDDISAITMQPDVSGVYAENDPLLIKEAGRKGKSFSRFTGRPVSKSQESLDLSFRLGPGVTFEFKNIAPPQIQPSRIYKLAKFHLTAFVYFITFDSYSQKGKFWKGVPYLVFDSPKSDWGHPAYMAFMQAVAEWPPVLQLVTARGFFKFIMRGRPNAICCSWALEWNKNHRIIGFWGEKKEVKKIVDALGIGPVYVSHFEIPLNAQDDLLFK